MAKVITYDGNIKIGAYMMPNRKKPCLCVEKTAVLLAMELLLMLKMPIIL